MISEAIDFEKALNEEQYAAVTSPVGPALVLAGAGSGKTRTLTYRVAYLLQSGMAPWEILLLTFTNKAAKEMLSRVQELTGVGAEKFWGGTFHHIGQRILRKHAAIVGLEPSFTIVDAGDAEALLGEVIRNIAGDFFKSKDNPKARLIADIISYARNTRKGLAEVVKEKYPYYGHLLDQFAKFKIAYQEEKLKQKIVDYDDLLEYWLEVLIKDETVAAEYQQKFKAILVDEYQDTNTLQAEIIDRMAAGHHNIMAVGDDAQCIYTWRGANFENIMSFPKRHPGTVIHKIVTNYRSTPDILNMANAVLKNQSSQAGYQKELIAVRAPKQKPYFVTALDTKQQAAFVAKRIQGAYNEGRKLSDIAVLYRAHHHAIDLQMELSKQGVNYQITSGVKFFEQAHVKDLVAQVRFAHNAQDKTAFYRFACLLPKVGEKAAEKLFILVHDVAKAENKTPYAAMNAEKVLMKVPEVARDDWNDLAITLQDITENMTKLSPEEVVKIALEGWYSYFIRTIFPNWRTRQDDLESLVGFAKRFHSMEDLLAQLVLLNSETTESSMEGNEDTVRLTTIHQAKGLEFPIVFIIGLGENLFPSKRSIEDDNLEEERRLFYVAVTRARDELYMSYPKIAMQSGPPMMIEPSRFINEICESTYENLKLGNSLFNKRY